MKTLYQFEILVYAASLGDEYTAKGLVYADSYADAMAKLEKDYTYHDKDNTGRLEMSIAEVRHLEAYTDGAGQPTDIYEEIGYDDKFKELREKGEI